MSFPYKWLLAPFIFILFAVVTFTQVKHVSLKKSEPIPKAAPVKIAVANADTPTIATTDVHASDGKVKLIMDKIGDGSSFTYKLSVSDIAGSDPQVVYTTTLPANRTLQLPLNSWSPDDKHFFVKETGVGNTAFYVFKADGEAFASGQPYIDVVSIFDSKENGYTLTDVTGWDSSTLLHIFSINSDNEKGPAFWFEVPTGVVIQLARR